MEGLTLDILAKAFEKIKEAEAKSERGWKELGISFVPKQILVGPQTWDRIKEGFGNHDQIDPDYHREFTIGAVSVVSSIGVPEGKIFCLKEPIY